MFKVFWREKTWQQWECQPFDTESAAIDFAKTQAAKETTVDVGVYKQTVKIAREISVSVVAYRSDK